MKPGRTKPVLANTEPTPSGVNSSMTIGLVCDEEIAVMIERKSVRAAQPGIGEDRTDSCQRESGNIVIAEICHIKVSAPVERQPLRESTPVLAKTELTPPGPNCRIVLSPLPT